MKKKILLLIISLMVCLPLSASALEGYVSMNLEETLAAEGIKANLDNYEETDDKITIYMFRGQGCTHCQDFLEFLSSIIDSYGDYFKLESYETWYDSANNELLTKVSVIMDGEVAGGVPYIVIGEKTFAGYASSLSGDIKKAITNLYSSDERYDVMEHLEEYEQIAADISEEISEDTDDNSSKTKIDGNIATLAFVAVVVVSVIVIRRLSQPWEEENPVVINQIVDKVENEEIDDNTVSKKEIKEDKKTSKKEAIKEVSTKKASAKKTTKSSGKSKSASTKKKTTKKVKH